MTSVRYRGLATTLLAVALALLGSTSAKAETTISASVTYSGAGTSYSQPSGSLTIAGSPTPVLTLANSATSSGIQTLRLGFAQAGSVQVLSGAILNTTGGTVGYAGTGTATISGSGSTWTGSFDINVGFAGATGTMQVLNGGLVNDTNGYIGRSSGAVGTVTVSGSNSRWQNSTLFYVGGTTGAGNSGVGALNIFSGGNVTAGTSNVGYSSTSTGTVTVSGTNSTWTTSGDLTVGVNGTGTLNILNGGVVSSANALLGNISGSRGFATITGSNSRWNATNVYLGGGPSSAGGTASMTIAGGGTLSVTGAVRVWNNATLSLQTGGTLRTTTLNISTGTFSMTGGTLTTTTLIGSALNVAGGTFHNNGSANLTVTVSGGGVVGGNGTFNSLAVNSGGAVGPGNSPGTLTSSTTAWNTDGKYVWEINALQGFGGTAGGTTGWDLWSTGALTIGGPFTIELHSLTSLNAAGALSNWDSSGTYSWLIATSTNSAFLDIDDLVLNASGFSLYNSLGGGSFDLLGSLDGSQLFLTFTAVPEPGSLLLVSLAAAGLAYRVRRKRRGDQSSG